MKRTTKYIASYSVLIVALVAVVVSGCSCTTSKPTPDPLIGFHFSSLNNLHSNKVIMDDYQDYIQKLPPEERKSAGPVQFFEDETGQCAVMIIIGINGTVWEHVLIYDKESNRIKTIKYSNGGYRS